MRKFIMGVLASLTLASCEIFDDVKDLQYDLEVVQDIQQNEYEKVLALQNTIDALTEELRETEAELQTAIDLLAEATEADIADVRSSIVKLNQTLADEVEALVAADAEIRQTVETVSSTLSEDIADVVDLLESEIEVLDIELTEDIADALQEAQDYADANDSVGGYNDSAIQNAIVAINSELDQVEEALSLDASIEAKLYIKDVEWIGRPKVDLKVDSSEDYVHTQDITLPEGYYFRETAVAESKGNGLYVGFRKASKGGNTAEFYAVMNAVYIDEDGDYEFSFDIADYIYTLEDVLNDITVDYKNTEDCLNNYEVGTDFDWIKSSTDILFTLKYTKANPAIEIEVTDVQTYSYVLDSECNDTNYGGVIPQESGFSNVVVTLTSGSDVASKTYSLEKVGAGNKPKKKLIL